MSAISPPPPQTSSADLPPLPLTLEGSSVLHQMFRVRWPSWKALDEGERVAILREAASLFEDMEARQSAIFSLLGHKGDLLLVHYRNSFDELNQAELQIARTKLFDYLEQTTSYLSVVELGLYKSSIALYRSFAERGVEPYSKQWNSEIEETMQRQREAMRPRLYPAIPPHKYLCFYPMDRRRGEHKNWYRLAITERGRQMEDHGNIGQRYAGTVKQIISGSIGFDDWEWGVDLYADDPIVFKKLIYEMRFDEVSAVYSDFGTFYMGVRCPAGELGQLLSAQTA